MTEFPFRETVYLLCFAGQAYQFFAGLQTRFLERICDLHLGKRVMKANSWENRSYWPLLAKLMSHQMTLKSVSLYIPASFLNADEPDWTDLFYPEEIEEFNREDEDDERELQEHIAARMSDYLEVKTAGRFDDWMRYWWVGQKLVVNLLMSGKIEALKLDHADCDYYNSYTSDDLKNELVVQTLRGEYRPVVEDGPLPDLSTSFADEVAAEDIWGEFEEPALNRILHHMDVTLEQDCGHHLIVLRRGT